MEAEAEAVEAVEAAEAALLVQRSGTAEAGVAEAL